MKKLVLFAAFCGSILNGIIANAQEKCGFDVLVRQLEAKDPSLKAQIEAYQIKSKQWADAYNSKMNSVAKKTTTTSITVPVVFHVILTQDEINSIGGTQGIYDRVAAQIGVLNDDYNARNSDSSQIPSAFKNLYGNARISFGVAHRKSDGAGTTGVEIKVAPSGFTGYIPQDEHLKETSNGGLDAWDKNTYINVWVVNIQGGSVLGYSYSNDFAAALNSPNLAGIVLHYQTLGRENSSNITQNWISNYNKGRTLTHEMGHYFDLWHIWGKTGDASTSDCSDSDYIDDTPNQSNATEVCETYPLYDQCTTTGKGVLFCDFMDYVPDACMHLFTTDQALHMYAQLAPGGMAYGLTQHPEVLSWPTDVTTIEKNNAFDVFPNPSNGVINVNFATTPQHLQSVTVLSLAGQVLMQVPFNGQRNYSMDMSTMARGMYIIQCRFEDGVVNRKVILQ